MYILYLIKSTPTLQVGQTKSFRGQFNTTLTTDVVQGGIDQISGGIASPILCFHIHICIVNGLLVISVHTGSITQRFPISVTIATQISVQLIICFNIVEVCFCSTEYRTTCIRFFGRLHTAGSIQSFAHTISCGITCIYLSVKNRRPIKISVTVLCADVINQVRTF